MERRKKVSREKGVPAVATGIKRLEPEIKNSFL